MKHKTRSFLIDYSGFPYTITSFMLDNGLAVLAGILHSEGHETQIFDYSTLDYVRDVVSRQLHCAIKNIWNEIIASQVQREKVQSSTVKKLLQLNDELKKAREMYEQKIGWDLINKISKEKPDFIGFKLWSGDGLFGSANIARIIKKQFPNIKIYAGGPHVCVFYHRIFSVFDTADVLSFGDGEESIIPLAEYSLGKRDLKDIPNIIYKENNIPVKTRDQWVENFDTIPFPLYDSDIYPGISGDQKIKVITMDESRGCVNRCAFCLHPIKSGKKRRVKSPGRIIDEMKFYMDKYNINCFQFAGSNPPYSLLQTVSRELAKTKLHVGYSTMTAVPGADEKTFQMMKQGGAYSVLFGAESGSDYVLRKMNKPHTKAMIKKAILAAKKAGLFVCTSFIYPAPFDTKETKQETLDFIREIKPDAVTGIWGSPVPGTPWAENPENYNIEPYEKNKEQWILNLMEWKASATAAPPEFTPPLPYYLNGLKFEEYCREHDVFFKEIENMGIITATGSSEALIAKRLNKPIKEAKDMWIKACYTGDYELLKEMIYTHNHYQEKTKKEDI